MGLRTTFNKVRFYFTYPKEILSKRNNVGEINLTELLSAHQVYLIRNTALSFDDCFYTSLTGKISLRSNVISPQDIINLSMNMLGGGFQPEHVMYRLPMKKVGGEKWIVGSEKKLFGNLNSIELQKVGCSLYVHANKIHDVPKNYEFPSKGQSKMFSDLNLTPEKIKVDGVDKFILEGKCEVKHDPLNFNYWHTEYIFKDFKGERISRYGKGWKESFAETMISDVFTTVTKPSCPNIENIPTSFYKKAV